MILRKITANSCLLLLLACGNNNKESNINEGVQKILHPNGQVHGIGNYSSDLPEGLWMFWNEDGNPWEEGYFINGKRHGIWKMFDDKGRVISVINYRNGIKNGIYIEYNYKWGMKMEGMVKNNVTTGMIKYVGLDKDTSYSVLDGNINISVDYNHFTDKLE